MTACRCTSPRRGNSATFAYADPGPVLAAAAASCRSAARACAAGRPGRSAARARRARCSRSPRPRGRNSPGRSAGPGADRSRRAPLRSGADAVLTAGAARRGRHRRGLPPGPSGRVWTSPKLGRGEGHKDRRMSGHRSRARPCRPADRRRAVDRRRRGSARRTAHRRPRDGSRTPCAGSRRVRRPSTTPAARRPRAHTSTCPSRRTGRAQYPGRAQLRLKPRKVRPAPARAANSASSSGAQDR